MSLDGLVTFYNNGEETIKPKIQHLLDDFYRVKETPVTKTCEAMDRHGSNKNHRQHVIYCPFYDALFKDLSVIGLLEFGIGSQNNAFAFTMGGQPCKPGGSLRAWQELFPDAQIFGADIDKDVLFQEDKITTYFVDAFDFKSISDMWKTIHTDFTDQKIQIIVDDAHHTIAANLNFLQDRKSTRLNSSHMSESRMPSSA